MVICFGVGRGLLVRIEIKFCKYKTLFRLNLTTLFIWRNNLGWGYTKQFGLKQAKLTKPHTSKINSFDNFKNIQDDKIKEGGTKGIRECSIITLCII